MTTNIDLFNQYTAQIFAKLYGSFPVPISLSICDLSGHHTLDEFGRVLNETGTRSQEFMVCRATVIWLEDSGYLKLGTGNEYGNHDCTLTAKGLEVLKAIPESIKTNKTIGEVLIDCTKTGSAQLSIDLAKAAISSGVALALRGVAS